ncbi:MAG: hypothetical protein R3Y33_03900 [Clostridia bacterium]
MSDNNFQTYRGKDLVRCGNTIYYGNMKDSHVVKIDIKTKKKLGEIEVADKVSVQLIATDPTLSLRDKIVKTSEKTGLYLALDIADVWLSRITANKEETKTEEVK